MRAFRAIAVALAVIFLGVASNQCISRGFIYSSIGSLFTWSGSAPSGWNGSNQIASTGDFEAYVRNNGTCGSPSAKLITYATAVGCAVNSSGVSAPTDPWFINGGLDWTTVSGSPTYSSSTDNINSPPSGAKDANSTSGFVIEQALNGGTSLIGGTHVTVSFDSEPQTNSINYYSTSSCTTTANKTVNGTTAIELLNSSGSVVFSQTDTTTSGWSHMSAAGNVPSSGQYYVAIAVTGQSASYSYYTQTIHGCTGPNSGTISAGGRATNIGASN